MFVAVLLPWLLMIGIAVPTITYSPLLIENLIIFGNIFKNYISFHIFILLMNP